ncbi:MAG: methyltransferase [Candidatus Aminicenantes bacterium]|jgi:hypothetical protein
MDNKEYFSKNKNLYKEEVKKCNVLYRNIANKLNEIISGKLIDWGNGGIINYDNERLKKVICFDIINENKILTSDKTDHLYGDFYQPEFPLKPDYILIQFLLHHLVDDEGIKNGLKECRKVLEHKNQLIVVEMVLPVYLEVIQNALKPLLFLLLTLFKKPTIRFFSKKSLFRALEETGFNVVKVINIELGKSMILSSVISPKLKLKLPTLLYPTRCVILLAE